MKFEKRKSVLCNLSAVSQQTPEKDETNQNSIGPPLKFL